MICELGMKFRNLGTPNFLVHQMRMTQNNDSSEDKWLNNLDPGFFHAVLQLIKYTHHDGGKRFLVYDCYFTNKNT